MIASVALTCLQKLMICALSRNKEEKQFFHTDERSIQFRKMFSKLSIMENGDIAMYFLILQTEKKDIFHSFFFFFFQFRD